MLAKLWLIFLLSINYSTSNQDVSSPFGCSTDDLKLTTTCRPKLAKLTDEMKKHPIGTGLPDSDTMKKMTGYCEDALKCMNAAKCDAIRSKTVQFQSMCDTITFLSGSYAQCSKKIKDSPKRADCMNWFYSDKSKISVQEKCDGFKTRKQCIQNELKKNCGVEAAKNFDDNLARITKTLGCIY